MTHLISKAHAGLDFALTLSLTLGLWSRHRVFFTEFFCHRSVPSLLQKTRFRRDPRQLEEEEEMWFNSEDDDVEENGVGDLTTPASVVAAAAAAAAAASSSSSSSSSSAATSPTATSPLGSTSLSFSFFFEKMWTF